MKLTAIRWYFRRPLDLLRLMAYKVYELSHPGEPWITPGSVRFCEQVLTKQMIGLEWGSGRSTRWFGKRLKRLVSIEHDPSWFSRVSKELGSESQIDLRLIPLDHDLKEPTLAVYPETPRYVRVVEEFADKSLDFVVIDGHYRQACVLAVLSKVKPGGFLLIDNTNWMKLEEWGVPQDWTVVHQSRNFMTETTIWRYPTTS